MRVRWLEPQRERGAVLLIVAISLIALLGFVGLVVDLGGLVARRRAMVQGADAAALAAAQSCGRQEGAGSAIAQADQYAADNESVATQVQPPQFDPDCDAPAGQVTVWYQGEYDLYVAPLLGLGSQGTVTAQATAIWGGAGGLEGVMPFMLNYGRLNRQCDIPLVEGSVCTFWLNNQDIGNAQWSAINLNEWNVAPTAGCTSAGTVQTIDWIQNGSDALSLNWEKPTYVCRDTGVATPVFTEPNGLASLAGEIRYFPVNDAYGDMSPPVTPYQHGQVDQNGVPCPPPCSPHKYDIVGFAVLEIVSVERGNQGGEITCNRPPDANAWCLKAVYRGYVTSGSEPGGVNLGIVAVQLVK